MSDPAGPKNLADGSLRSSDGSSLSNASITDTGARYLLALGVVGFAAIAVMAYKAGESASDARRALSMGELADMRYTLCYNHLVNMDGYLQARGVPVKDFGPLPPPTKETHE